MLLNSALKIQCHIVKNTLRHTAFSAILLVYYARICFREKPVCLSSAEKTKVHLILPT